MGSFPEKSNDPVSPEGPTLTDSLLDISYTQLSFLFHLFLPPSQIKKEYRRGVPSLRAVVIEISLADLVSRELKRDSLACTYFWFSEICSYYSPLRTYLLLVSNTRNT